MPVLYAPQKAFLAASKDGRRGRAGDHKAHGRAHVVILLQEEFPARQPLYLIKKEVGCFILACEPLDQLVENGFLQIGGCEQLRIVEREIQYPVGINAVSYKRTYHVLESGALSHSPGAGDRDCLRQFLQVRQRLAHNRTSISRQIPFPVGVFPPPWIVWSQDSFDFITWHLQALCQ